VDYLIGQGADLAFQDNNGAWSLTFGVSGGNSEVVDLLMKAGAPLDLKNSDGVTMLHFAAMRGMNDVFDKVVAAGIDPDTKSNTGAVPLHWAASGGQPEMIARLIAAGADPEIIDEHGITPLLNTLWRGQPEAMKALIKAGADVNRIDDWERSPLWVAAGQGESDAVKALIAAGADPDQANIFGETPLLRAARQGKTANVDILIAAGAKPDTREAHCGRTALHLAAMSGYGDCVESLAKGGASLKARDHHGKNPLDLARTYGHKTSAKTLTATGAVPGEDDSPCPAESGCLAVCKDNPSAKGMSLAGGEARLWYLGHSGYAVQTENNLLVFDYFPGGRGPDEPALCNGYIDPKEIAGMNVTVFVSHEHRDHFTPGIFEWTADVPDIRYVMGCPAETDQPYDLVEPRQVRDFDGVKVRTIESNDSGVGFVVEVDGMTIYHAGDHANRQRDFSGPYCAEIDWLAEVGVRPDVALMPVSGCGFGDQEAVRLGVNYALEKLQPRVFIPLHSLNSEYRYKDFIDRCRNDFPGIRMVAPGHRGDHYDYRKGEIG
ncbi:MAG: ankyrin repeat domain-containing protein, partial [Candidatus Krumholzibacteriota bacterium]